MEIRTATTASPLFIKFQFKNTCKKVSNGVKSFSDIVTQARNLFGEKVNNCIFCYEDVDEELINVTNDEDVKTLLQEALQFKLNCVKIVVQATEKDKKQRKNAKK